MRTLLTTRNGSHPCVTAQVLAKRSIPIGYSTTRRNYVPGKGIEEV